MNEISSRLTQPTPDEIRRARVRAGLTQTQAALMISSASARPWRTWQNYESPVGQASARPIPLATWELFLVLTNQHPHFSLKRVDLSETRAPQIPSSHFNEQTAMPQARPF